MIDETGVGTGDIVSTKVFEDAFRRWLIDVALVSIEMEESAIIGAATLELLTLGPFSANLFALVEHGSEAVHEEIMQWVDGYIAELGLPSMTTSDWRRVALLASLEMDASLASLIEHNRWRLRVGLEEPALRLPRAAFDAFLTFQDDIDEELQPTDSVRDLRLAIERYRDDVWGHIEVALQNSGHERILRAFQRS